MEAVFLPIIFDPHKRPEENLSVFFTHLKQQDMELGQLLESKLLLGAELTTKERAEIAKQAVAILKKRAGGGGTV
jgi:hypothetical protein